MKTLVSAVILTIACSQVAAQEFERRLLPITVRDVAGALGSTWRTTPVGINEVSTALVRGLFYLDPRFPPPAGIPWSGEGITYDTNAGEPPGSIVYVPREHASAVHMSVHLRQSGPAGSDEIELPVIPENEFGESPIYFLWLQNSPDERSHLRVYSLDLEQPAPAVRIQILALHQQLGWLVRYDQVVSLRIQQRMSGWPQPLPVRPWAAEMLLDPAMESTGLAGPYTIIVTPDPAGLRIWAFVSETHNQTQRVQLVMPR